MLRHLVNILLFYLPPSRLFLFRRLLMRLANVRIGEGVSFCGRGWIYGRGELIIGARTWISPGCNFFTHSDVTIVIGSDCDIGPNVNVIVGSHQIGLNKRRAGGEIAHSIKIGNGCWIGANVTIIDGVEVSDGCVVAAGTLVNSNIPPNVLVAGIPSVIKRRLN